MFAPTYFPNDFFPADYFPAGSDPIASTTPLKVGLVAALKADAELASLMGVSFSSSGGYLAPDYYAPSYFPASYFGGSTTSTGQVRIYPSKLPPRARRPAIVYHVASDIRGSVLTGQTRQRIARVLIDCHGYDDLTAEALARVVDSILGGFVGSLGGCDVKGSIQQGEADPYDTPDDGSDKGVFIRSLDYRIDYRLDDV